MSEDQKVRENRLRRMAERRGYVIRKSRIRDPRGVAFGRWDVVDLSTEQQIVESGSLDVVEEALEAADTRSFGWVKAGLPEAQRAFPCSVCHHRFDNHGARPEEKKLLVCMFPGCGCGSFRITTIAGVVTA